METNQTHFTFISLRSESTRISCDVVFCSCISELHSCSKQFTSSINDDAKPRKLNKPDYNTTHKLIVTDILSTEYWTILNGHSISNWIAT